MADIFSTTVNIADITASGNLSALNATLSLETEGAATLATQLSGTFSATISFEASVDNSTWVAVPAQNYVSGLFVLSTTTTGTYFISSAGFLFFRIKVTSYTSGTIAAVLAATNDAARFQDAFLRASDGTAVSATAGELHTREKSVGTNSSTLPSFSTLVGGNDGTNIRPVAVRIASPEILSAVGMVIRPMPYEPKSFVVSSTATAIALNKSMLSLQNATGSGRIIKIRSISIVNTQTTATTGVVAEFRLLRFATHSAGTALTPQTYDSTKTLSASVTARTGGTVTSEAATAHQRWLWSSDEWGAGTSDVESFDHTIQTSIVAWQQSRNGSPITINENEGFHIKQITNSTNGTFDIVIEFTEETP